MARATFIFLLLSILTLHSANAVSQSLPVTDHQRRRPSPEFVGGVYAMANNVTGNTMVVYGRRPDGTLSLIDPALKTGGTGAIFNTGIFDPLFSAFAVVPALGNRFILSVNAGSNTVSVFRVQRNFSLRLVSVTRVPGTGPVSIAVSGSLVYVASADTDGDFDSLFGMTGLLSAFHLTRFGKLFRLRRGITRLSFRPAAIKFSADRRFLVVSNPFSGFNAVSVGRVEELFVFRVLRNGRLRRSPVDVVGSTALNNEAGRSLPGVIGFDVITKGSEQFVVAPEFRLISSDGTVDTNGTSSISTWRLGRSGNLSPVQLDLLVGTSFTEGEVASCWIQFSPERDAFWTANTVSDTVSAFTFSGGMANLETAVAGSGVFPVDMWLTPDGRFLYQLFSGEVGVFSVDEDGVNLTEIQRPMNVPVEFPQGIVAL